MICGIKDELGKHEVIKNNILWVCVSIPLNFIPQIATQKASLDQTACCSPSVSFLGADLPDLRGGEGRGWVGGMSV